MKGRWTDMLWGGRARAKREEAARMRQEAWQEWRIGPGGLWVLAYPSGSAIWFAADGHAGGAQHGRDLLCAAASAIWHTLRATAAELAAEGAGRILCDSLHTGRGMRAPRNGFWQSRRGIAHWRKPSPMRRRRHSEPGGAASLPGGKAAHGRRQAFACAASLPPKIGRGFAQEGLRARSDGFFGKNAR